MMLFDIIREMNDKLCLRLGKGKAMNRMVLLTATTDGYNIVVHFMGEVVWESSEWKFDDINSEQEELDAIQHHITATTNNILKTFSGLYL